MDKLDNDIISIIKKYLKCYTYLCEYYGKKLLYREHKVEYYCLRCYSTIILGYYNQKFGCCNW